MAAGPGELLFAGELEKWANTARGETWRKFNITLTNKEMRWHHTSEDDKKVFLGMIEVNRIVNVKIDPKCPRKEAGYSVFLVQDPHKAHEFRTKCAKSAEEWVQNIKNATLPKTRRKNKEGMDPNRNRAQSGPTNNDKTGYVTEVLGGIHIERKSDSTDNNNNNNANNFMITSGLETLGSPSNSTLKRSPLVGSRKRRGSASLTSHSLTSLSGVRSLLRPFSRRVSDSDDMSELPVNPEEDEQIIREGYLIKQGHKVKNWKRRWFTLSRCILAYRDEEGTTLKGQISISDIILARVSSKYPDKKFLFEVITKKRTYYMEASSKEEMKSWTDALSNILIKTFNNSDASSLNSC